MVVSLAGVSGAEDNFGRGVTTVGDLDAICGVNGSQYAIALNPDLRLCLATLINGEYRAGWLAAMPGSRGW